MKQAQDANELQASAFKGPQVGLLTQQRSKLQGVADLAAPGSEEQLEAQKAVAEKTKEIRDAENESYLRQDEIKVASAGKASAQIIAIRQAEVAHEIQVYGQGSKQAEAAEDRLARAKEQAANRGAASASKAAKDELGATEEGIKGQIAAIERHTAAVIDHYQTELKLRQITAKAEVAAVLAALAQEKAAVDSLYAQEAALAGLSLTKQEEIADQLLAFNDKNAKAEYDAQAKAAEQSAAAWKSFADQFAGILSSQVDGLLKGTETFSEAFKNMMTSAIEDIIKELIKMAAEWAVLKIVAPGVGGLLGGLTLPSFAVGAWELPRNTFAQLHQGEMVVPAGPAAGLRSALSGGGAGGGGGATHYHTWNVQASNPMDFARQVGNIWNRNPSLRPSY